MRVLPAALLLALVPVACTAEPETRPNVLLIVTDDQPIDTMAVMPATADWLGGSGTTFSNAYTVIPRCCPARASIMSGRYAHNHGVLTNDHTLELDQGSTVQARLAEVGYRTAIAGKFLNGWDLHRDPPHWDRWTITNGGYFDAEFNADGERVVADEYSTDYIGARSAAFLEDFETGDDAPWLLYVAPFAPHAPFEPAPEDAGDPVPPWDLRPSDLEDDRSDKPPFLRNRGTSYAEGEVARAKQLRTLPAVDRMIDGLRARLADLGELESTLVVFISDNGSLWGQHHMLGKGWPHLPVVRVPFFVSWPGHVAGGAVDDRLVANIDVAPTILDAAGLGEQAAEMDGRSLLPEAGRDDLLLEHWNRPGGAEVPTWAALVTRDRHYVEYLTGDRVFAREVYDLVKDPREFDNLAGSLPSAEMDALARRLRELRSCAGETCR